MVDGQGGFTQDGLEVTSVGLEVEGPLGVVVAQDDLLGKRLPSGDDGALVRQQRPRPGPMRAAAARPAR